MRADIVANGPELPFIDHAVNGKGEPKVTSVPICSIRERRKMINSRNTQAAVLNRANAESEPNHDIYTRIS